VTRWTRTRTSARRPAKISWKPSTNRSKRAPKPVLVCSPVVSRWTATARSIRRPCSPASEGCPADSEETFGPVAAVYEIDDEDGLLEKANDTEFGLGASIWTTDRARGQRLAREIDAGCVYINQLVTSDPRVPFGGVKESGYGLNSLEGMLEFVNRKTVWTE